MKEQDDAIKQLVTGIAIGSALIGSLVWAGKFYGSTGNVKDL